MRAAANRRRSSARRLLLGASLAALAAGLAGPAAARVYVVKPGDTLFHIARLEHARLQTLASLNNLAAPFVIFPGEHLTVDAAAETAPAAASPAAAAAAAAGPVMLAQATGSGTQEVARPGPAQPSAPPPVTSSPTNPTAQPQPLPAPRQQRAITIVLPLYDGPTYVGDTDAVIGPEGTVSISTSELLQLTKPLLDAKSQDQLAASLNGQTNAKLDSITTDGLSAAYDSAKLRIVLSIPGKDRGARSIELADLDQNLVGEVGKPEPFSAYLNIRSSVDYAEDGTGGTGVQNPTVLLNSAVRLNGFVLEADGQYAPGQQGVAALSRQDTRLIFDDIPWFVRLTAGDLQVTTRSFQGGVDLAGFSVERLYSELAPQDNIQPRGNQSFTLERESTVQTIINGRTVQQIRLAPGVYNLSDFPFAQGSNNVQLLITDSTGQREALNFSIFFDRSLLRSGLTEFGLYGGVESFAAGGNVDYTDVPGFTGFVRHGFTDWLTAGLNFQADTHVQMGGVESLIGTKIGSFGADFSVSNADQGGAGFAANIGYNLLQQLGKNNDQSQSLIATLQYRSTNFATIGEFTSFNHGAIGSTPGGAPITTTGLSSLNENQYAVQAGLNYNRTFSDYSFFGANLNYSLGRNGAASLGQFQVSYGRELTPTANGVINLEYDTSGIARGFSVRLSLTKRFGKTGSVRADYDSSQELGQVTIQDSHGRGVGSWNGTATVEGGQAEAGFNGDFEYEANRGQLGIAQTTSYDVTGHQVTDVRTTARFDTAIAFTGGHFAIGQPIYDSFAIFDPHPSLHGAQVIVDPSPEGFLARSGALGPALESDIGSYSVRTITYDVPNAPTGYDIGSGALRVKSPYRAGYFVEVGSDYSMTAIGRITDADGKPISLLAGHLIEEGQPSGKGKTVEFFTSRDGRFAASGLRPGRWKIDLPTDPESIAEIDIAKGAQTLVRVGDLKALPVKEPTQ